MLMELGKINSIWKYVLINVTLAFFTNYLHINIFFFFSLAFSFCACLATSLQNQIQIPRVKWSSCTSSIWVSHWIYFNLNANLKSFEIYILLKSIKQRRSWTCAILMRTCVANNFLASESNQRLLTFSFFFSLLEWTRVSTSNIKKINFHLSKNCAVYTMFLMQQVSGIVALNLLLLFFFLD